MFKVLSQYFGELVADGLDGFVQLSLQRAEVIRSRDCIAGWMAMRYFCNSSGRQFAALAIKQLIRTLSQNQLWHPTGCIGESTVIT